MEFVKQIKTELLYYYMREQATESFTSAVVVANNGTVLLRVGYCIANREWDNLASVTI